MGPYACHPSNTALRTRTTLMINCGSKLDRFKKNIYYSSVRAILLRLDTLRIRINNQIIVGNDIKRKEYKEEKKKSR